MKFSLNLNFHITIFYRISKAIKSFHYQLFQIIKNLSNNNNNYAGGKNEFIFSK